MGNNDRSPQQWQYSWEALSHVKTLRLYLFQPSISPQAQCLQLSTSLCPPNAYFNGLSLLIKWTEPKIPNGSSLQVFVRVPVPPVVLDHSIPVQAKAMSDHIEVKLKLMLPVDHPLVSSLSSLMGTNDGVSGEQQHEKLPSFSLHNDTRFLAMEGEVHFYCRNCSARLTKEPLRSFKELPSVNWRDIADNWFGTCCCTFGGVSQSLVSNFEKFSSVSKGTCFIGSTSILVHVDELASNAVIESDKAFVPDNDEAIGLIVKQNELLQINTLIHDFPTKCNMKDGILVQSKDHSSREKWECLSSHDVIRNVGNLHEVGGNGVAKLEKKEDYRNNHVHVSGTLLGLTKTENANPICDQELETMASAKKIEMDISASDSSGLSSIETSLSEIPTLGNPIQNHREDHLALDSGLLPSSHDTFSSYPIKNALHCCGNNNSENVSLEQLRVTSEPQKDGINTGSFYLGNGFMMGPPDVSDAIEWVSVRCSSCLSLIGSYPDVKGKPFSASESIRLFKCRISTNEAVGGTNDVFRKHTLQRIIVNQLQASAEDESSYRTVIRNLNTKVPLLQVVLLNANAWFCSGNCWERIIPGEKATYYTEMSIDREEVFGHDVSKGLDGTDSRPLEVTEVVATKRYNCKSLNPVVKVLFSDCSSFTPDESRVINDWALQTDRVCEQLLRASDPFRDPACKMVDEKYASLYFPFGGVVHEGSGEEESTTTTTTTTTTPPIKLWMKKEMGLEGYLSLIRSWSAYQTAKATGVEVLDDQIVARLKEAWGGNDEEVKTVSWAVFLRIGVV